MTRAVSAITRLVTSTRCGPDLEPRPTPPAASQGPHVSAIIRSPPHVPLCQEEQGGSVDLIAIYINSSYAGVDSGVVLSGVHVDASVLPGLTGTQGAACHE